MTGRTRGRVRYAAVLACVLAAPLLARADEDPSGMSVLPPILASTLMPVRQALIVAPGSSGGPRGDLLRADAIAYRDLLRLLGFEVSLLEAGTRPDLDSGLRAFARSVRRDGEVAILLLGDMRPTANGLAIIPAQTESSKPPGPERVDAEGLRPADTLRRIVGHGPRDVVVLADSCGGDERSCAAGLAALPEGVSAILARRMTDSSGGMPLDGVGSLRSDLMPAMQVEGQTLTQLYASLTRSLKGSDLGVGSTTVLTRSFAFLPTGFLAGLPLACNDVAPALSADELRHRPTLDPLVTACGEAARRYDFSPYFKIKLAIVRDQEAARKGLASCPDAAAYLAAFPDGMYRTAVDMERQACVEPPGHRTSPPAGPPPVVDALGRRATVAVADYLHRHDYTQGDSFAALARLYAPQVRVHGSSRPVAEHLRGLGAWYAAFDLVRFKLVEDSLELSGCEQEQDCVVRGRYSSNRLLGGEGAFRRHDGTFVVTFDLRNGLVLAECGVTEPPGSSAACD